MALTIYGDVDGGHLEGGSAGDASLRVKICMTPIYCVARTHYTRGRVDELEVET